MEFYIRAEVAAGINNIGGYPAFTRTSSRCPRKGSNEKHKKAASTFYIIRIRLVSYVFIAFCLFRFFKKCTNHDILFMVPEFPAKQG